MDPVNQALIGGELPVDSAGLSYCPRPGRESGLSNLPKSGAITMRFSRVLAVVAGIALCAGCDANDPSNVAPTAAFTVECDGLACRFSSGSADSDGSIAAYRWDFGDNQTSTEASPEHLYAAAGTYTVGLTVTDGLGETGNVSNEVSVTGPIASAGEWMLLASMPEARSGTGSAALDGIVYVAGGIAVAGDGWVTRPGILAYDPATNEWRTAGTLTRPVAVPGVASLGNRLYVVGGRDENLSDSDDLQILDPATSQVEMGPAMPTPRGGLAVTVLDSRLHAIGGESLESDEASFSHEVFDPATGAWSSRARAPIGGNGIAAATIDGRIYIVGHGNSRLYVYSPATDTWTTHAAPLDQANSAAVALGGKFYVLGGGEFGTAATGWIPSDRVDRFDPETGVWDRAAPIPSPRSSPSAAVVGDAIYLISGWTGTGLSFNYSALNERYTLE